MYPYVTLFGRSVPSYWLCALAGLLTSSAAAFFRHRKFEELQEVDVTNSAALLLVGAVVGGRIVYLISILPVLAEYRRVLMADLPLALRILSNGLVFYGGLFGALIAMKLYSDRYSIEKRSYFDFFVPLIPLFHAFGRIGCFLTGCCHGVESARFGIAFSHSLSSENGIPYFPVQLLGSLGNLVLCVLLWRFESAHHKEGKSLRLYLGLYAVGRFLLEFLRGDTVRGVFAGLSTSQWISLAVLAGLALTGERRRPAADPEEQGR